MQAWFSSTNGLRTGSNNQVTAIGKRRLRGHRPLFQPPLHAHAVCLYKTLAPRPMSNDSYVGAMLARRGAPLPLLRCKGTMATCRIQARARARAPPSGSKQHCVCSGMKLTLMATAGAAMLTSILQSATRIRTMCRTATSAAATPSGSMLWRYHFHRGPVFEIPLSNQESARGH